MSCISKSVVACRRGSCSLRAVRTDTRVVCRVARTVLSVFKASRSRAEVCVKNEKCLMTITPHA
eukprot:8647960-Alexandrium_andersonii.AAC.1